MKKLLIFALILASTLSTIGCDFFNQFTKVTTQKTATSSTDSSTITSDPITTVTSFLTSGEVNDLTPFITAINNFDSSLIYGHSYAKAQEFDDFIIYILEIDLLVVSLEPTCAKLLYFESKLADFESDEQYDTTEYELYFFDDETIKYDDGVQSSSSEQFSSPEIELNLVNLMIPSQLSFIHINDDHNELEFTLPDAIAQELLNEEVSNLRVYVGINENKVSFIGISYELDGYTFLITHEFTYSPFSNDIMIERIN